MATGMYQLGQTVMKKSMLAQVTRGESRAFTASLPSNKNGQFIKWKLDMIVISTTWTVGYGLLDQVDSINIKILFFFQTIQRQTHSPLRVKILLVRQKVDTKFITYFGGFLIRALSLSLSIQVLSFLHQVMHMTRSFIDKPKSDSNRSVSIPDDKVPKEEKEEKENDEGDENEKIKSGLEDDVEQKEHDNSSLIGIRLLLVLGSKFTS